MTIKRIVNGKEMEFALSEMELYQAYLEQQESFMRSDVEGYLDSMADYGEEEEKAAAYLLSHEDALTFMVNNYIPRFWEIGQERALESAFEHTCEEYEEEIENVCE